MTKEMYHYEQIMHKIEAEKAEERRKKEAAERQRREEMLKKQQEEYRRKSAMENSPANKKDPFKDFDNELARISDKEAVLKIKQGRDATYKQIDLLYRTDWKFEKKENGVKIYSLVIDGKKP